MFYFFSRKEYLVDHISGLVDMHNHILPGIDDGAKNLEESIALIHGLGQFGITNFICTPHIMHNYYDNRPKHIKSAYKTLKSHLASLELEGIKLFYAAEHMIDDNFEELLSNEDTLSLDTKHLLVEMSYLQPPINFSSAMENIKRSGLFPVLAHPERYPFLHNQFDKYIGFKENNIQFQLNLLSLGNYYGKDVSKIAYKLLDKDLIDYVASDAHHMNHIAGLKAVVLPKKYIGKLSAIINNTIETFY